MKTNRLALVFVFVAALSRLLFLNDMEFKADEKATVEILSSLFSVPYSPLAPVSYHSGLAHSSGFFYFLRLISFGSNDPLMIVSAIAFFSSLSIAIPAWFLRTSKKYLLCFAMIASSFTLFLGTRKIWTPDLVAAWIIWSIGLFFISELPQYARVRKPLLALSGICSVMAVHMYLAAAPAALMAFVVIGTALLLKKDRAGAAAWISGSVLAWLTFVPYAYLMFTGAQGTTAANGLTTTYTMWQFNAVVSALFTVPSPFNAYALYLRPVLPHIAAIGSGKILGATLFWLLLAVCAWLVLFWWALYIVVKNLAQNWRSAFSEPMLLTSLLVWLGTGAGLFFSHLGAWLNYWFGVLPFAYYMITWACFHNPESKAVKIMRRTAWAACLLSFVLVVHFALLVHQTNGLPGEYGPSYQTQVK
jgi:hypothetical protein